MTLTLAIVAVSSGLLCALLTTQSELWSRIFKIVASTAMVGIVVAGGPEWSAYAVAITIALVTSWVGDLALSFSGQRSFLIGLISFALAHAFYTIGFFTRSSMDLLSIALAGVAMAVTAGAIMRWLAPHTPPELATPVTFYVGIISVMVVTAFGTSGTFADPRIPTAAVLFAISDVLVARQQFVTPAISNRVVGLPIYYAAQVLFAVTVVVPWS